MKRFIESTSALFVLFLLLVPVSIKGAETAAPPPESPQFPIYVMNKIDDQYRGAKSHGVMEMAVKTRHFERSLSLESWSLGRDYSLVRILKPLKEKGTATLKARNDLYTYLSKTDRTIKISSAMMGGAWMGSHFTNDDLVRHSRLADDFTITLSADSLTPSAATYDFTLVPKPDAAVVWGKVTITVRKIDLQPLEQRFFDEKGKPVRVLEFSRHEQHGDRIMPMEMVMKPLDDSGEYTKVSWKEIDFGVSLDKDFFSIQHLRSL